MIDFRIERSWSRHDGYDIWVLKRSENGRSHLLKPTVLEFQEMPEAFRLPEPSLQVQGELGRELITAARTAFAEMQWYDKKDMSHHAKVESAMQAHIDSLKMVVDRTVRGER